MRDDLRATKATLEENGNLVRNLISLFREIEKQSSTGEKLTSEFRTRLMAEVAKLSDSREKIENVRVSIHEDLLGLRHRLDLLEASEDTAANELKKMISDLTSSMDRKFETMDKTVASAVAPLSEVDSLYSDTSEILRLARTQSGLDMEGKQFGFGDAIKRHFSQGMKSFVSNVLFAGVIIVTFFILILLPRLLNFLSTIFSTGMKNAG